MRKEPEDTFIDLAVETGFHASKSAMPTIAALIATLHDANILDRAQIIDLIERADALAASMDQHEAPQRGISRTFAEDQRLFAALLHEALGLPDPTTDP